MPKFYKQNKKRIDARYFLHETIEEADDVVEESNTETKENRLLKVVNAKGIYKNCIAGKGAGQCDAEARTFICILKSYGVEPEDANLILRAKAGEEKSILKKYLYTEKQIVDGC